MIVALLVGAWLSSVGGTVSHGLAALSANGHGHVHDIAEGDVSGGQAGAPALQGHQGHHGHEHSPDHSHDKAHRLPAAPSVQAVRPMAWGVMADARRGCMAPARLDRPPMARHRQA